MCASGGDGGDQAAELRRQEAQTRSDLAKIERTIYQDYGTGFEGLTPDELLSVYGIKAETDDAGKVVGGEYVGGRGGQWVNDGSGYPVWQVGGGLGEENGDYLYGTKYFEGYPQYTLRPYTAGNVEAFNNWLTREKRYDDTHQDILNYFVDDPTVGLNRQRSDAGWNMFYDLARRGMTGGSADATGKALTDERYGVALADVTTEADSAIREARAADEALLDTALNLGRSTQDASQGLNALNAQRKAGVDTAFDSKNAYQLAGTFADLEDLYNMYNYRTGQQQGVDQYSNPFSPGSQRPGTSGSIY